MEDFAPSSSLFVSADNGDGKETEIVFPSPVLTCILFCLFIRWGLPPLISLFNSNSSSSSAPETENVVDPTPGRLYDVFLNHRGPDVKKSLASIIYYWLEDKGLRVFLDQEEFQAGEGLRPTIQQAISSAFVHIAIFSKRYAESSWCLDELCSMLKSGAKDYSCILRCSTLRTTLDWRRKRCVCELLQEHLRKSDKSCSWCDRGATSCGAREDLPSWVSGSVYLHLRPVQRALILAFWGHAPWKNSWKSQTVGFFFGTQRSALGGSSEWS